MNESLSIYFNSKDDCMLFIGDSQVLNPRFSFSFIKKEPKFNYNPTSFHCLKQQKPQKAPVSILFEEDVIKVFVEDEQISFLGDIIISTGLQNNKIEFVMQQDDFNEFLGGKNPFPLFVNLRIEMTPKEVFLLI